MTHTAYKVTVCGRYGSLSFGQTSHMASKTRSAGRCADNTAGINKDPDKAFLDRLHVDRLCRRDHDRTDSVGDLTSLQNLCSNTQIRDTSVGAGTDHYLIDLNVTGLCYSMCILRKMRE